MSKYHLTELIKSLNKEEIRNFKLYASRFSYANQEKKIITLFDNIKTEGADEFSDTLISSFFPLTNKNAYYRLKKRLIEEIEYSLLNLNRTKDHKLRIMNLIQLGRIFMYKSHYDKSEYYFIKSEKEALKLENYHLLSVIYDEFLSLCVLYDKLDPKAYIEKIKGIEEKYKVEREVRLLLATINYQLRQTNFSTKTGNVIPMLEGILDDLAINKKLADTAIIQFRIHECARGILLQKRDFETLQGYLEESLAQFESKELFSKTTHERKIVLLHWLINASIKNKAFQASLNYTQVLYDALFEYEKIHHEKYLWVYYQGVITNNFFLNKSKEAIELLEKLANVPKVEYDRFHSIFIYLNLATLYYCQQNVDKALEHLANVLVYDNYKSLSENLKLAMSVAEVILRIENEDYNYALHRLKEIKRIFRKKLVTEEYQRENNFVKILKSIANTPQAFKNKRLTNKVKIFIDNSPKFEPGSNEAINYRIWLYAKLNRVTYYDVLLEEVGTNETIKT
ncbi:MAG: hypothetical protein ACPGXL_01180 [Chitinophagales bacterium]